MNERKLLMIPGPIEFEPDVLAQMAVRTPSHVAPDFIAAFSECLINLRTIFGAPNGQPFVVAGSGTLAMEMGVANLLDEGDRVVGVATGYFSDRMKDICERHGGKVEIVPAPLCELPYLDAVEAALAKSPAKLLTITHVDTSTGTLAPLKELAAIGKKHGALVVVDGVCATAGEEMYQEEWGIDIALTASQKALGAPPGLAVLMASQEAMKVWKERKTPVRTVFGDFGKWLPIMEAYEAKKPSYFATPACNLVLALHTSVKQIVAEGMAPRFARHAKFAKSFRAGAAAWGIEPLPKAPHIANCLSAVRYPEGVDATLVKAMGAEGVVVAGGLHPELKTQYFRVGHMGAVNANDIIATVGALGRALAKVGKQVDQGAGLAAAQNVLLEGLFPEGSIFLLDGDGL